MQISTPSPLAASAGPRRRVLWGVQLAVSVVCLYLVIHRLDLGLLRKTAAQLASPGLVLGLAAALALTVGSILAETLKWFLCVRHLAARSFWVYLRQTLAGLAAGLPLSHLVGDYTSKLAIVRGRGREALPFAVLSSYSQYLVSVLAGMAGLWLVGPALFPRLQLGQLGLLLAPVAGLLSLGYFFFPQITRFASAQEWLGSIAPAAGPVLDMRARLLCLSLSRYVFILGQYVVVLGLLLQGPVSVGVLAAVALMLGLKTIVPFLSIGGFVGLRELLAIELLAPLGIPAEMAATMAFLVWILNLALPAAIGAGLLATRRARLWQAE